MRQLRNAYFVLICSMLVALAQSTPMPVGGSPVVKSPKGASISAVPAPAPVASVTTNAPLVTIVPFMLYHGPSTSDPNLEGYLIQKSPDLISWRIAVVLPTPDFAVVATNSHYFYKVTPILYGGNPARLLQ